MEPPIGLLEAKKPSKLTFLAPERIHQPPKMDPPRPSHKKPRQSHGKTIFQMPTPLAPARPQTHLITDLWKGTPQ